MSKTREISSTVSLRVIAAIAHSTGEVLTPEEFEQLTRNFLEDMRAVQQELVNENASSLPDRNNAKFGSEWARENVRNTDSADKIINSYIERYWTLNGCKSEAARIILSYRHRVKVWEVLRQLGDNETFEKVRDVIDEKWLDYNLYKNVKNSKEAPGVPELVGVQFPYCQMNAQVVQQKVFLDGVILHRLAMGTERYEVLFDIQDVFERYPDMKTLSRPTVIETKDGKIVWHFSAVQQVDVPSVRGFSSVVAFDRNMDHSRIISGVRANRNGHVSGELGPSVRTLKAIDHSRRVSTDLARKKQKLRNAMPWDLENEKAKRLSDDIERVGGALNRLHDALDVLSVNDMLGHLKRGDLLVVEKLDMFGGGLIKFRHGRSDDRLEHKCARLGIPFVMVNPAGTTSSCPHCGAALSFKDGRVVECGECGFVDDRDCASAPIIAGRGLDKSAGRRRYERRVARAALTSGERRERAVRARARRVAKMERRRVAGRSVRGVGCVSSPSRPVLGVREGVSGQEASLARVRALLGEKRITRGDGVSNDVIAGFYRFHGLGSWATNTLYFEYGLSDMRCSLSVALSTVPTVDNVDISRLFANK